MWQHAPPAFTPAPPGAALEGRLAAYADRLRYDDLDAATIERANRISSKRSAAGLRRSDERPVRICRDVALAAADGVATVIGTNRRTTPDLASFANGAAFRYYDLNDVYVGRLTGHPSDHIAAWLARTSATLVVSAATPFPWSQILCRRDPAVLFPRRST